MDNNRQAGATGAVRAVDHTSLASWFAMHDLTPEDDSKVALIRGAGFALAKTILENTPPGPDQTAAIRKVRESVFTANAAIACAG